MNKKFYQKGLAFVLALAMILSLLPAVSLTARAAEISATVTDADYTLYYDVNEGKMYKMQWEYSSDKMSRSATKGEEITSPGFTASGNTLTLNNFQFTTSAETGMYINGNVVLVLNGTNSIVSTAVSNHSCGITVGDYFSNGVVRTDHRSGYYNLTVNEGTAGASLQIGSHGSVGLSQSELLYNPTQAGILANNLTIGGGTVTIEVGGTPTDSTAIPTRYSPESKGINCSNDFTMTGGTLKVTMGDTYNNNYGIQNSGTATASGDAKIELNGGKSETGNSFGTYIQSKGWVLSGNAYVKATAKSAPTYSSYGAYLRSLEITDNAKMVTYGEKAGAGSTGAQAFSHILAKGGDTEDAQNVLTFASGYYQGKYATLTAEPQYTVAIGATENGTATIGYGSSETSKKAYAGDRIRLVATPSDNSYRLKEWRVDGADLSLDKTDDISFKMPAADITITPIFERYTAVTKINLNKTSLNYSKDDIGKKIQLTATVEPKDATDQKVKWESDEPSVAKVDENGLVTIVGAGTATIYAQSLDGSVEETCRVKVSAPAESVLMQISNSAGLTLSEEKPYYVNGATEGTATAEQWNAKFDAKTGTLYIKDLDFTGLGIAVPNGDFTIDVSGTNTWNLSSMVEIGGGDLKITSSSQGRLNMIVTDVGVTAMGDLIIQGDVNVQASGGMLGLGAMGNILVQDTATVTAKGEMGLSSQGSVIIKDSAKAYASGTTSACRLSKEATAIVKGSTAADGTNLTEAVAFDTESSTYVIGEETAKYLEFSKKPLNPGTIENDTTPSDNAFDTNLDETPEELKEKVLDETDKERIENGESAKVFLRVTDISGEVSGNDKKLVEQAKGKATLGMYIDISLYKQIGTDAATKVTNTAGTVTITIKVPERLLNTNHAITRTYQIVRIHNGQPEIINCIYNSKEGTISFETDAFSTYALVYQDVATGTNVNPNTNEDGNANNTGNTNNTNNNTSAIRTTSPKTGDNSNLLALWMVLLAISGIGAGYFVRENSVMKKD